jgi:exodeoxyribonuclease-3
MRIATWNINGVRARIDTALSWLKDANPDIVCFQETKIEDAAFPTEVFSDLGYNVAVHGQKGFNGVALLSKLPFDEVIRGIPGGEEQSRLIEGVFSVAGRALRVASVYAPNGNPIGSDKFAYKFDWMEKLTAHAQALLAAEEMFVLAGDFNVIPTDLDAHFPSHWVGDALFTPEAQGAFRRLQYLGLTDAFRACNGDGGNFTYWDYQAGSWQKDDGIRIDFALLSPQAADRLIGAVIDKRPRGWAKPSDHVPVVVELDLEVVSQRQAPNVALTGQLL